MNVSASENMFELGKRIVFQKGQQIRFNYFTICLEGIGPVSMGKFGGIERHRTNYLFKITHEINGISNTQDVVWSHGFPGDLAPAWFSIGRRKNFLIDVSEYTIDGGVLIVTKGADGPEYGETVTFIKDRILEYPHFDLVFKNVSSQKTKYTEEEKETYLNSIRALYIQQGSEIPSHLHFEDYRPEYCTIDTFRFELNHNNTIQLLFCHSNSQSITDPKEQVESLHKKMAEGIPFQSEAGSLFCLDNKKYFIQIALKFAGGDKGEISGGEGSITEI